MSLPLVSRRDFDKAIERQAQLLGRLSVAESQLEGERSRRTELENQLIAARDGVRATSESAEVIGEAYASAIESLSLMTVSMYTMKACVDSEAHSMVRKTVGFLVDSAMRGITPSVATAVLESLASRGWVDHLGGSDPALDRLREIAGAVAEQS